MNEKGGEPGVGIRKLPRLYRGDHIVRRDTQLVAALPSHAHPRVDVVADILVIPVEGVRAADDAEYRDVERRFSGAVMEYGPY
jgi:hypothetical protein